MIRKPESPLGKMMSLVSSIIPLAAVAVLLEVMAMVPKVDGYAMQDARGFGLFLVIAAALVLLGLFLFWFGTPDDIDPHKHRMRLLVFETTVGSVFGLWMLSWAIALVHLSVTGSWRFHHH